ALHAARIWKNNGNIRYKQDFTDTVYTVSGSKLIPAVVFNLGKYHWPVQERRSEKNTGERIFIADIFRVTALYSAF
ncbi:MAG: 6-bladed beta-propeller, partial [Tannerella sp.]|nr:6-bladed beta-propeller [Tannerella sp.]